MLWLEGAVDDGCEVAERAVLGCRECGCGLDVLGGLAVEADAEFGSGVFVVVEGVDVASGAVDLHVLAGEGPVP